MSGTAGLVCCLIRPDHWRDQVPELERVSLFLMTIRIHSGMS